MEALLTARRSNLIAANQKEDVKIRVFFLHSWLLSLGKQTASIVIRVALPQLEFIRFCYMEVCSLRNRKKKK